MGIMMERRKKKKINMSKGKNRCIWCICQGEFRLYRHVVSITRHFTVDNKIYATLNTFQAYILLSVEIIYYTDPSLPIVFDVLCYDLYVITFNCTMPESARLYRTFTVFCEGFEVIMDNQVSRCFKTTVSDQSVCAIFSGRGNARILHTKTAC